MDPLYLFACGTEWRLTIKSVAGAHLAEAGWRSMFLLNAAVASGELGRDETIACSATILRSTTVFSLAEEA
jgi:hypothetical protein